MDLMMTPGPVQVPEEVRMARSLTTPNSDLDPGFFDFYHDLTKRISRLLHTNNETLILSGEGILGLEAACASLTEPGDMVLVLDNGIYGKGFQDFVRMYGGIPDLYSSDPLRSIDSRELKRYLQEHHNYKYATLVHCDTPSGMLNDIHTICPILKSFGILTVVDSVSGMFGNPVDVDRAKIDVLLGGSQKAVSAPPGLTLVTLSADAKKAMKERTSPIASFYGNLTVFDSYYENQWFPYTMPSSDIYGLDAAIRIIEHDPDFLSRHHRLAQAVRAALRRSGISLHLNSGFSDTVTVFDPPAGISAEQILTRMKDIHHVLLAGSFGELEGKVIRIGHMGANANLPDVLSVMTALEETFLHLGVSTAEGLADHFLHEVSTL